MSARIDPKIFSLVFAVIYTPAFYFDWSLVKYYPQVGEFHFSTQSKSAGPVILWYGWMATSILASSLIASIVPRRWAERLSPGLSWIIPAIILVVIVIYEKRWFI